MANSELYDKKFPIPQEVIKSIQQALVQYPDGEGTKRAKFIVNNKHITYQSLKRIKNFFDNFNPSVNNKSQYELAGGNLMKGFIDRTLNTERDAVSRSKKIKQDVNVDVNLGLKPHKANPRLNENQETLKHNAVAIIFNDDNKILLLKRSSDPNQWCPNKWAFVGGGVENGETPEEGCVREIKEETQLEPQFYNKKFSLNKNDDSVEHVFACKYSGDPMDVTLNGEHEGFGWFSPEEMEFLDTVPNLKEFLIIGLKINNSEIT